MTTFFERLIRTLLLVCLTAVAGSTAAAEPAMQASAADTTSRRPPPALPEAVRRARLDAITQARAGAYEPALDQLIRLRNVYPDSDPLFYDEMLVRFWAGQRQPILDMIAGRSLAGAPAYALLALGRAARDTRDFGAAINYYAQAVAASPESIDARVGLAMAYSDYGDPRTARTTLEAVPSATRHTTPVLVPSAYLFHQDQAYAQALGEYDLVLQLEPENRAALRGKAQALRALLLPRQALRVAALQPDVLTPRELNRLEADVLALDLRDAIESPAQRYPFPGIESALQAIAARLAAEPPASELARLLTYDRIVGLAAAHRRSEAVEDYRRLIDADPRAPRYVHAAAGNAYLALRKPELAEQALRRGIEADPADMEIRISLFYALIELERFEEAFECIDDVVERLEPVRAVPGSSVRQPNPAHTRATIVATM
ncbi:MAG: tetratricopeptide repeat protein, partial [Pseudomonadales bacterium]|nr:tetratricopeptide repeat protein [Pseudomonadales bacterium]